MWAVSYLLLGVCLSAALIAGGSALNLNPAGEYEFVATLSFGPCVSEVEIEGEGKTTDASPTLEGLTDFLAYPADQVEFGGDCSANVGANAGAIAFISTSVRPINRIFSIVSC